MAIVLLFRLVSRDVSADSPKTLHCSAVKYCHKKGGAEGMVKGKKRVGKVLEDEAGGTCVHLNRVCNIFADGG